ncbi:MAG TPA: hypothetical protein VGU66_10085 [Candidatus Elarobacter sp.]|nr:hypothetical protein [Candidatus Elarobacter sp.]
MTNDGFELPDGRMIKHAPSSMKPVLPPPSADTYHKFRLAKTNCLLTDGTKCVRLEHLYVDQQSRAVQSKRSASDQYITEYCFETENSYVDENGTIWGASVECNYYLYDDGTGALTDPGGGGSGGGGGTPVTTCKVPGASMFVNSFISMSPIMQALLASISANNGPTTQPTFTETSLPQGTIAQADYANHTIKFDSSQAGAAQASGQDIGAIIEHELLHLWMETGNTQTGVQPHPFPQVGHDDIRVVTLDDGTTLTFHQTATRNPVTGHIELSPGYAGYEHVLIHEILVRDVPDTGDATGSLMSAFLEASSVTLPGGQPQTITDKATANALANARTKMHARVTPPVLPTGLQQYRNCKITIVQSVARATSAGRNLSEIVVFNGETYEVPWDGARY